jgi:hypothetical protein
VTLVTTLPTYGLFAVDSAARTVRGILLPWGQRSRTSISKTKPITFPRGSVSIPRDPAVVGLNRMHDRFDWIGRAVELEDAPEGIVATFRIADTEAGDEWLEDHGELVKLSPEVRNIVRNPDDTGTAELTAAALVDEGAFAHAALFAVDRSSGDDVPHDPGPRPQPNPDELDLEDDDEDEDQDDDSGAESEDEPDPEPDETEEDTVAEAVADSTMLGSRGRRTSTPTVPELTRSGFFAALRTARTSGDRSQLAPYLATAVQASGEGLFALSNVTFDDAAGLVKLAGTPGAWLGQLWQGKRFSRKIVPLLTSGTLTSMTATGWVWGVKPSMAAWAGNKTPVPSNAPSVTPKTFPATRFAGGHDLAREYYDFNVTEVIDSYWDAMVDSYAMLSDAYALQQVGAGATPYTPDPANTVNTGLLDIVDGALAVVAAGGTPSWAIVATDVFKSILATPHEDALDYFNAAVGLEGGTLGGGASFGIIPDARLTAGQIIVGDKGGATAWELPGVPIRVSAPDLVLGGIDNAAFGYIGVGVTNPAVVVKNTGVAGTTEGLFVDGFEEDLVIAAEKSRK